MLSVLQWTEKIWSIRHQAAAVMIGGWGPVQNRRFLYSWFWRVRSQILGFRPCQAQIWSPFWIIMIHLAVIATDNWCFVFNLQQQLPQNGSLLSIPKRTLLCMVENLGFDFSHAKINDLKIGGFGRVLTRRSLPPPPGSVLMRSFIFLKHIYNGVNILESFARVSTRWAKTHSKSKSNFRRFLFSIFGGNNRQMVHHIPKWT